jgi:hypothetical protein
MIAFDYVIRQEDPVRPAVAIEVLEATTISEHADEDFRKKLWNSQTRHGVLFSREKVRVYEDLLPLNDASAYKYREAETSEVLKTVSWEQSTLADHPEQYLSLVKSWVELLVANWNASIPPSLTEEFIGLVPAAAEGELLVHADVEDLTQ